MDSAGKYGLNSLREVTFPTESCDSASTGLTASGMGVATTEATISLNRKRPCTAGNNPEPLFERRAKRIEEPNVLLARYVASLSQGLLAGVEKIQDDLRAHVQPLSSANDVFPGGAVALQAYMVDNGCAVLVDVCEILGIMSLLSFGEARQLMRQKVKFAVKVSANDICVIHVPSALFGDISGSDLRKDYIHTAQGSFSQYNIHYSGQSCSRLECLEKILETLFSVFDERLAGFVQHGNVAHLCNADPICLKATLVCMKLVVSASMAEEVARGNQDGCNLAYYCSYYLNFLVNREFDKGYEFYSKLDSFNQKKMVQAISDVIQFFKAQEMHSIV